MWRARVTGSHRPDSWTRLFVGDVIYVQTAEPILATAGTVTAPYEVDYLRGYDVCMEMLTPEQHAKLAVLTAGFLLGDLFVPAECVEVLENV